LHPLDRNQFSSKVTLETKLIKIGGDAMEYAIRQFDHLPWVHWKEMDERTREQWCLAIFVFLFNQQCVRPGSTIKFNKCYLVHWGEWGTLSCHSKLTTLMREGTYCLPLVVELGESRWAVVLLKADGNRTIRYTPSLYHAIAIWFQITRIVYGNRLENNDVVPEFGLF